MPEPLAWFIASAVAVSWLAAIVYAACWLRDRYLDRCPRHRVTFTGTDGAWDLSCRCGWTDTATDRHQVARIADVHEGLR